MLMTNGATSSDDSVGGRSKLVVPGISVSSVILVGFCKTLGWLSAVEQCDSGWGWGVEGVEPGCGGFSWGEPGGFGRCSPWELCVSGAGCDRFLRWEPVGLAL